MYKHLAIVALVGLALGGCATRGPVPDDKVVDIDPVELERKLLGEKAGKAEPTPDQVVVGDKDGILVEVSKRSLEDSEQYGLKLQTWDVTATNLNPTDKCITLQWRLMDFKYIMDGPSEQYIKANDIRKMGEMQQRAWIIDGVPVAVPPSGYLSDMRVRSTIAGARQGEECMHITPEDDIETEPDVEK